MVRRRRSGQGGDGPTEGLPRLQKKRLHRAKSRSLSSSCHRFLKRERDRRPPAPSPQPRCQAGTRKRCRRRSGQGDAGRERDHRWPGKSSERPTTTRNPRSFGRPHPGRMGDPQKQPIPGLALEQQVENRSARRGREARLPDAIRDLWHWRSAWVLGQSASGLVSQELEGQGLKAQGS